jgi:hypothetical protein
MVGIGPAGGKRVPSHDESDFAWLGEAGDGPHETQFARAPS